MVWTDAVRNELRLRFTGPILFDEPAAAHASIRAGGKIDALIFPENIRELSSILEFLRRRNLPFLPVGNWTNLIVRDGGFRGTFISLSRLRKLSLRYQGEEALILAEAGCPLADLVKMAVAESLSGMEFSTGIPGSVGGAIRMNAGAYGGEIKDIVEELRIIDLAGKISTVTSEELKSPFSVYKFSYRNFALPADSLILAGMFRLRRGKAEEILTKMAEILKARREKHPLELPNAGSIFKNPADCPAGRMIEASGLKGSRIGDAQISEKHGNFIVNRGQATASEIIDLITMVREAVFQKTGRLLETEVKIVGES
ncbi:MAG: UDP-N-acetylmuramate dehydrogenase [Syntrophales bacterium]